MHRYHFCLLFAFMMPCAADEKPATPAAAAEKPAGESAEPTLPKDVLDFYGKITGTVESVDVEGKVLKLKVTEVSADAEKNKAPKPETLNGMSITVTPLEKKQKDGSKKLDAAAVAWMKGAKAGDTVKLSIRASSKGVVFRLLTVPGAAGK